MDAAHPPSERDVALLVTFLADSNEKTVHLAKEKLKQILRQNPSYRQLLESTGDPSVAQEARLFLEETRLEDLEDTFRKLGRQGESLDLEEGSFRLATLAYPNLERSNISTLLDDMAQDMEEILDAEEPSPSQSISLLRKYLFHELGFHGNQSNYYDPDNSYLNRVLERRLGIPISLCTVYLLVAWRLDFPAHGIGLPGHFIIGHEGPTGTVYVDPFHDGRILTRVDCIELVRQRGIRFQEEFLAPTPANQILARMVVNLMNIYTERGDVERAQWLARLVPLVQGA